MGMQQYKNNILEICAVLSEQENLQVTLKESAEGAVLAAVGAGLGGLLGGRVGLAIGGSLSSILAAAISDDFKSVPEIIRNDLTPDQKQRLFDAAQGVLTNVTSQDYVTLLAIISSNPGLRRKMVNTIRGFFTQEQNYELVEN